MIVRSHNGDQPRPAKRPKNDAEAECYDWLREAGYSPVTRGYADYQAWDRDGHLRALVEVKPKADRTLKHTQRRLLIELSRFGLPTFAWSPDGGFEPIGETKAETPFTATPQ